MKILSNITATAAILIGLSQPVQAALYNFSTSDGGLTYVGGGTSLAQLIPDNTMSGVGYSINFGATGVDISSISVSLNLSGGYNGDIYAYLSHGGILVQLLNPNVAVSGAGIDITLNATGGSIPTGGGTLSGNYASYGDLTAFNGTSASGNWTVFFADLGAGDKSTLNSFSVNISALSAVPEPVNAALGTMGGLALLIGGVRWQLRRRKTGASGAGASSLS